VVEAASGSNRIVLDPGANELLTAADVSQCEGSFNSSAVVLTQLEIPVAAAEAVLVRGRARGAVTVAPLELGKIGGIIGRMVEPVA
jgi:hypothetical protein